MTGRLTAAAEWKSVAGHAGELDGYMSVFNVLDDGGMSWCRGVPEDVLRLERGAGADAADRRP
jgi:hypothetical protein